MWHASASWAIAVSMAVVGQARAADGFDLAPRFERGAKVFYVTHSIVRHEISAELLETDEKVTVTSDSGMSLVVGDVATNGEAELIWTPHFLVLTTDGVIPGMDQALDYDSRSAGASNSPLAPTLSQLIGKPMSIRVDPHGQVLSFSDLPMDVPNDPVAQLARSFFSREAFAQLPLFITAGAPSPAKVRDQWTHRQRVDLPLGNVALEINQTLRCDRLSPMRKLARLNMEGTVSTAAAGAGAVGGAGLLPGATLTVEEGTTSGAYEWDFAYGRLRTGETRLDLVTRIDTQVGKMTLGQHLTASITLTDERVFDRRLHGNDPKRKRGER